MTAPLNEAKVKLLESALKVFAEKGYEGASIREIIEEAGVTRPVLYYYFKNKEELYSTLVLDKFTLLTDAVAHILEHTHGCIARLKAVAQTSFDLAEKNPLAVRFILQAFFAPPLCGPDFDPAELWAKRFWMIETIMRDGLEEGILTGGDSKSLTLIFQGVLDMHVMAKSGNEGFHLSSDLAAGVVDFFLKGAATTDTTASNLVSPYEQIDNHVLHEKHLP